MPVDIDSLITGDTYPDVVNVPSTGEVITESSLIDLGVALGDRIEFVKKRTPEATDAPEDALFLRDDFYGGHYTGGHYYGALVWHITDGSGLTQGVQNGQVNNNPGTYVASVPSTDTWAMSLSGTFSNGIRLSQVDQVTIVAAGVTSNVADAELFLGLATTIDATTGPGNNAVGLWYSEATEPTNWMVRHKVAGVDDATVSATPFVTAGFVVFKLVRISTTQMEAYINGTLVATLTHGTTLPLATNFLNIGFFAVGGSAASLSPAIDLITVRATTTARQS